MSRKLDQLSQVYRSHARSSSNSSIASGSSNTNKPKSQHRDNDSSPPRNDAQQPSDADAESDARVESSHPDSSAEFDDSSGPVPVPPASVPASRSLPVFTRSDGTRLGLPVLKTFSGRSEQSVKRLLKSIRDDPSNPQRFVSLLEYYHSMGGRASYVALLEYSIFYFTSQAGNGSASAGLSAPSVAHFLKLLRSIDQTRADSVLREAQNAAAGDSTAASPQPRAPAGPAPLVFSMTRTNMYDYKWRHRESVLPTIGAPAKSSSLADTRAIAQRKKMLKFLNSVYSELKNQNLFDPELTDSAQFDSQPAAAFAIKFEAEKEKEKDDQVELTLDTRVTKHEAEDEDDEVTAVHDDSAEDDKASRHSDGEFLPSRYESLKGNGALAADQFILFQLDPLQNIAVQQAQG